MHTNETLKYDALAFIRRQLRNTETIDIVWFLLNQWAKRNGYEMNGHVSATGYAKAHLIIGGSQYEFVITDEDVAEYLKS